MVRETLPARLALGPDRLDLGRPKVSLAELPTLAPEQAPVRPVQLAASTTAVGLAAPLELSADRSLACLG